VFREGTFGHLVHGEEARHTFGVHDERIHPGFRVDAGVVVRHVGAGPALGLGIPPDQLLAFRPGFALGVGGGAVVEDATVRRPGEGPVLVLLRVVRVAVVAPRHQVALLGPGTAEDPAARGGTAVILELAEVPLLRAGTGHQVAVCVADFAGRVTVELLGQLFGRGLVSYLVGPVQVEDRLGEDAALAAIQLTQAHVQAGHDPDVGARFARTFGRFPVPLQPAGTVDQRTVFLGDAGGRPAQHLG